MKYCSHCGKPISDDTSFCTNCGAALGNNPSSGNTEKAEPIIKPEHIEKIKKNSRTYFHYFLRTLKKPSSSLQEDNKWYGYVTCILLSLCIAITIYRMVDGAWTSLIGLMGLEELRAFYYEIFGSYISEIGFSLFFKLFFYHLVFLAAYVGVCYGINIFLLKNRVDFHIFLTRFSGFSSLALAIYVIAILFSLILGISGYIFIITLVAVGYQLVHLAFTIMLVLPKNNGPIDRFYIITIGWAIMAIISVIFVRITINNLVETFNQLQNNFPW